MCVSCGLPVAVCVSSAVAASGCVLVVSTRWSGGGKWWCLFTAVVGRVVGRVEVAVLVYGCARAGGRAGGSGGASLRLCAAVPAVPGCG
jgi:hypothetical protein